MAATIFQARKSPTPRRRTRAGDGEFYAGQVVRILNLKWLDYDQLTALFKLVSTPRKRKQKAWRRFTLEELAALRVASKLIGTSAVGRRARLMALKQVCQHLQTTFGFAQPLLQVKMEARGTSIIVELDGRLYDPSLKQTVFDDVTALIHARERGAPAVLPIRDSVAPPSEHCVRAPALNLNGRWRAAK